MTTELEFRLRFRTLCEGPPPRLAKMASDGSGAEASGFPRPSQCPVFVAGANYGVELLFPYGATCQVTTRGGVPNIEGDFGDPPSDQIPWPPVRWVNPEHYSVLMCVDLVPPQGYVLRVEPHPRFFQDSTGEVPAAVVGNLEGDKWPMFIFLTFKAPVVGRPHVLKHMDPLAQIICVPRTGLYSLTEMTAVEKLHREELAKTLSISRDKIATRSWISKLGHRFDNLYRVITRG